MFLKHITQNGRKKGKKETRLKLFWFYLWIVEEGIEEEGGVWMRWHGKRKIKGTATSEMWVLVLRPTLLWCLPLKEKGWWWLRGHVCSRGNNWSMLEQKILNALLPLLKGPLALLHFIFIFKFNGFHIKYYKKIKINKLSLLGFLEKLNFEIF